MVSFSDDLMGVGKSLFENLRSRFRQSFPSNHPELRQIVEFPTGQGHKPFCVDFRLFPLEARSSNEWRLLIETQNARHPYDSGNDYNYFGPEIVNPALMSALDHTKTVLEGAAKNALSDLSLLGTQTYYPKDDQNHPRCQNSFSGVEFYIDFNNPFLSSGKSPQVSYQKMKAVYDRMVDTIKGETLVIQKHIEQSTILQPSPNSTHEDLAIFDAHITSIWHNAIVSAFGDTCNTIFIGPDGKKWSIVQGKADSLDP